MTVLSKPKRVVNKSLLDEIRKRPCIICGWRPCDPHHIKSRGAGGGDTPDNILPLCRRHHSEIHQIGARKFLAKYGLFDCYNIKATSK